MATQQITLDQIKNLGSISSQDSGSVNITGSMSGSFSGDGSGLTGVATGSSPGTISSSLQFKNTDDVTFRNITASNITASALFISGSQTSIFIGNVEITGSLVITSSATFRNIGMTILEGPTTASIISASSFIGDGSGLTGVSGITSLSPSDIGDVISWYDVDALPVVADGTSVATFTDQSGNGYDAVQATGGKQGLYKTNRLNGKPSVLLDGVNDFYSIAAAGAMLDLTKGYSVFAVVKRTTGMTGTTAMMMMMKTSAAQSFLFSMDVGAGIYYAIRGNQYLTYYPPVFKDTDQPTIYGYLKQINADALAGAGLHINGSSRSVQVGAVVGGSDNVGFMGSQNGTSDFYGGEIFEIVTFNKLLSGKHLRGLYEYFSNKYGI